MKNFIKLFLLSIIVLSFASCKQTVESTEEEKFEDEKYKVYESFIGEYKSDGYLDLSGYVPYQGSKYEGQESLIFNKDSVIFNKKEYSLKLLCPCELLENHPLFKQRSYIYNSELKSSYYEYNEKKFNSYAEMNLDFEQTYIINDIVEYDRIVYDYYGYFYIPDYHTHYKGRDIYEVIIPIEDNIYIHIYSYGDGNGSVRLYFSLGLNDFETYSYKEIRVQEVNRDAHTNNGNWYNSTTVDIYEEIDESSRKIEQYITSNFCEYKRVVNDDDNNSGTTDDDSQNDDENNGTEEIPLDFSITGDWSYSIQDFQPTTLTLFQDETFEFNKNNDITTGTYALSGNKITFDFEKGGQEITDTFIISGSENEITLNLVKSITTYDGSTQESTTMSYMLLAFYTTMETSITLTK